MSDRVKNELSSSIVIYVIHCRRHITRGRNDMRNRSFNIKTYLLTTVMVIVFACLISACGSNEDAPPADEPVGLANPASVHCEEQGGELEIRTGDDGGEYGVCMFDDGTECEEWAYFREECAPGMYEEWVPE